MTDPRNTPGWYAAAARLAQHDGSMLDALESLSLGPGWRREDDPLAALMQYYRPLIARGGSLESLEARLSGAALVFGLAMVEQDRRARLAVVPADCCARCGHPWRNHDKGGRCMDRRQDPDTLTWVVCGCEERARAEAGH